MDIAQYIIGFKKGKMLKKELQIIVDSREQKPLWLESKRQYMKTGDYSFEYDGVDYSSTIAIERKSLPDLFGTLGNGSARFKKEIKRALIDLDYFAIIIDGDLTSCVDKSFAGAKYIKLMKGDTILKILSTIHLKYGIPFFFTNTRNESRILIKNLFESYIKIEEAKDVKKD